MRQLLRGSTVSAAVALNSHCTAVRSVWHPEMRKLTFEENARYLYELAPTWVQSSVHTTFLCRQSCLVFLEIPNELMLCIVALICAPRSS